MIGRISQFMCNAWDLTGKTPTKIVFPADTKHFFHMPTINEGQPGETMECNHVRLNLECGSVDID